MLQEQPVAGVVGADELAPASSLGVADLGALVVLPAPAEPFDVDAEADDAGVPAVAVQHQLDQGLDVGVGRLDLQPDPEAVLVELLQEGFVGVLV